MLFGDPRMNIPEEVRAGVIEALGLALNERNRANKKIKLGYSTSEDALAWAVFKHLHDSGQLTSVLGRAGLTVPDDVTHPEAVLFWGVPNSTDRAGDERGRRLRARLLTISDRLQEGPRSRTEPDVVIDLGPTGLIIIEVKHRSGTDIMPGIYPGWDRYYSTVPWWSVSGGSRRSSRMSTSPRLMAETDPEESPAMHTIDQKYDLYSN